MARELTFSLGAVAYTAAPVKVERKKLYGWSETAAFDDSGQPLQVATLDATGTMIIPPGGGGLGLLAADLTWVERSSLQAVTPEGVPAPRLESSYDAAIALTETATSEDLLSHVITAVYQLSVDPPFRAALGEQIFRFSYAYRAGYTVSPAFVLAADEAVFMLVGQPTSYEFLGLDEAATVDADEVDEPDELDFDFAML